MQKAAVLVVDKDGAWSNLLAQNLQKHDFHVDTTSCGRAAVEKAVQAAYDVVIVDLMLADMPGMESVRLIREVAPSTKFIVLTGRPTQDSLMEAVREHISDYLCKPIDMNSVIQSLNRAIADRRDGMVPAPFLNYVQNSPSQPNGTMACSSKNGGELHDSTMLVGDSEIIRQVRQQIAEVTPTNMTVLIRGESGTGKGVVARMIHELSPRHRKGTLVKINCPAIPETLLESELFGHEAGAFTGAEGRKPGRFELANGGTIFMDEIGEIPPQIQVKLLHVIEHKELQRIGGSNVIHVDARILAATNASLEHMIATGQFRADLLYRLNEYSIFLPPLRQRVEDIPLLADHFLRRYSAEFGHAGITLSSEVMGLLLRHQWFGNVRELESVIRRFALTGREESIKPLLKSSSPADHPLVVGETETLRQTEIQTLMSALVESRWNQRRAATILGISYSALRRRIEKYGLKVAGRMGTGKLASAG